MIQTIKPECVEEMSQIVAPWQLTLRQLGPGALEPQITATAIDDIIVTNDRWSGYVHGYGGTAAGHVTICGVEEPRRIQWNGHVFDEASLPVASGSSEWEFSTPQGTNHWVIMIPEHTLADRLGLHPTVISSLGARLLRTQQHQFQRLNRLAWQSLRQPTQTSADIHESLQSQVREQILEQVADLFDDIVHEESRISARGRTTAYRRAIRHIDSSPCIATPSSAAAAAGVSLRVLQLAFLENLGITPKRFIRLCRLNRLHSMLRASSSDSATVTSLMEQCGFSEFGRVAGQYRQVFGELPSQTLDLRPAIPSRIALDAINP